MKFLAVIWVIFLPTLLYFFIENFYSHRSVDLTRNWLKIASDESNTGHMASSLALYQRLIISSDFIKGVTIYDSSLKIVSSFGDIDRDITPSLPDKEVDFVRSGFFSYRTTFVVPNFGEKYVVVFFFSSQIGRFAFLGVVFGLLILSLIFIALFVKNHRKEMNKRLSVILRVIESYSHDVGNTLNWTQKLINAIDARDSKRVEELSRYVDRTLAFANSLRQEMLSLSKPVLNNKKSLDLRELYHKSMALLVSDISRVKISENFKHSRLIDGDELKLSRVIVNLMQNSLRHASSFINISTKDEQDTVVFEITNDGDGIPKSILDDIFKPFVSSRRGSGLGLYICKTFIQLHGGGISVSSSGDFTKIKFWLPALLEKRTIKQNSLNMNDDILKVALIDDEVELLNEFSAKLEGSNIELSTFTYTDAFFGSILEGSKFDVVVVDRFGPGFDSVNDNFPTVARQQFGFQGKIVLYSNSIVEPHRAISFDLCLSKDQDLNAEMLFSLRNSVYL